MSDRPVGWGPGVEQKKERHPCLPEDFCTGVDGKDGGVDRSETTTLSRRRNRSTTKLFRYQINGGSYGPTRGRSGSRFS